MPYPDNIFYSDHGEKRRQRLGVRTSHVRDALQDGTTIETYPDTGRGPSYLLLHWIGDAPIHVVAADKDGFTIIVTVYDPRTEPDTWTDNYSQRR